MAYLRGFGVVATALDSPFQYNPVSKKLNLIKKARAEITFTRSSGNLDETLLRDRSMEHIAPGMFFNYESAKAWYSSEVSREDTPQSIFDYVIITTNAIESNSNKLSSFVTHKQNQGHSVLVVTYEDDIQALTGQAPDNRAEKIRQWLIDFYSSYDPALPGYLQDELLQRVVFSCGVFLADAVETILSVAIVGETGLDLVDE